ncbi:hypothetical protein PLICRDRAFT_42714 [Plicaturopsis crispa FD-325 SS-3]|nr:hypothetical protein PLICRDRAFT_42714 [Plicaturopsis crispa FD-325 SS-3]
MSHDDAYPGGWQPSPAPPVDPALGPPAREFLVAPDPTNPRSPTWVTYGASSAVTQHTIHPLPVPPLPVHDGPNTPRPIPIPSPAVNARGAAELASTEEYMTVDAPPGDVEAGYSDVKGRQRGGSGSRGIVGGFVRGLKKIPKAMMLSNPTERRPTRRGTADTYGTGGTAGTDIQTPLPQYESAGRIPTLPENARYVQGMDMPMAHPAAIRSEEHLQQSHSRHPSSATTHDARTHDSYTHDNHTMHTHDSRTLHHTHDSHMYDGLDGDTTAVHHDVPPHAHTNSPVFIEPRPASDYDKMSEPIRPPSARSFSSSIMRVARFFRELNDLPWVSERVAADYFPAERHRRARRARPATISWYTHQQPNQSLDLLSNGTPSPAMHQIPSHRHRMPHSSTTLAMGNDIRRRSPERATSPHYPYGYTPQPLYIYPGGPPHGSGSGSSLHGGGSPELHQPVPVYMVAGIPQPVPPHEHVHSPLGNGRSPRMDPSYPYPVPQQPPRAQTG